MSGRHRGRGRPAPRLPRAVVPLAIVLVLVLALALGLTTLVPTTQARFSATTANANSFAASAVFPNYATTVAGDSPILYHRLNESPSSAATSTAADSSGGGHAAVYNGRTDGPSTWWKFEEGSGTSVIDSAGGLDSGALRNGLPWTASGKYGSAGSFDGVDDSV